MISDRQQHDANSSSDGEPEIIERNTKGKDKFIIPKDDSDDIWEEDDGLDDAACGGREGGDGGGDGDDDDNVSSEEFELIEEDPFEPVYASPSAEADGITIEAVSLDNILPEGATRGGRRGRN